MTFLYILLGLIVAVGLYVLFTYNSLVALRNRVSESWSDIQVQMKRRYDLIPNLVEAVKGYAGHEKKLLEAVTQTRVAAMGNSGSPAEQAKSENMLEGALKSLFAVSENYPDLKANQNFLHLQGELAQVEDKIQYSRRYYNANVLNTNVKVEQFPSNLVAQKFGFIQAEFFELDSGEADAAAEPVAVKFD